MRIRRTIDIAMSNYEGIMGAAVFTYEGRVVFTSENMEISDSDTNCIVHAWNSGQNQFTVKHIPFLTAMSTQNGLVGINPDGAVSIVCGTGKGVWFVAAFVPMDEDKHGILKECIQAAKLLETSVSIFDV